MKGILVYQPPDKPAQLPEFIDGLDPRLREKIIMQLYQLSKPHKPELREPHFKRFSLERYRDLCELRVKSKMLWHKKSPAPQKRCQAYLPTVIFSHPKWLLKNSRKSFSSSSSPPTFSIYGANFFRSKLSFFGGIAALRSSAALASRHAA